MSIPPSSQVPPSTPSLYENFQEAIRLSEKNDITKVLEIVTHITPILQGVLLSEKENEVISKIFYIYHEYLQRQSQLLESLQQTQRGAVNKKYTFETSLILEHYAKCRELIFPSQGISQNCVSELFDYASTSNDTQLGVDLLLKTGYF